MKEELLIERFEGVYGAADPRDLTPGTAAYAENLDAALEIGLFKGVAADRTALTGTSGAAYTLFEDGTTAVFVDRTTGAIRAVNNLSTAPSLDVLNSLDGGTVARLALLNRLQGTSDGQAVRIGSGHGVADYPVRVARKDGALVASVAHVWQPSVSLTAAQGTTGTDGYFTAGEYQYGCSFLYDGFQEGPLFAPASALFAVTTTVVKTINVQVAGPLAANARVTHIVFYRKDIRQGLGSDFSFVRAEPYVAGSAVFFVDTGTIGATYSQRTGMPETLSSFDVKYSLCCVASGHHFVGNCFRQDVPNAKAMIFRSKPYRFDTFDWTQDYLTLPTVPTALCSFAGRVFAFSEGRTYVVSPDLSLEDTWEGIGCSGPQSLAVTDAGLFFCNKASIYHYDGRQVQNIGQAIATNQIDPAAGWTKAQHSQLPVALYDGRKNAAIFAFNRTDSAHAAYIYHVDTSRFSFLTFTEYIGSLHGGLIDKDGRPYLSIGSTLYEVMGHATTRRAWTFRSHTLNQSNHPQTYYKAKVVGRASQFTFYENHTAVSQPLAPNVAYQEVTVNRAATEYRLPWDTAHTFAFEVNGSGTDELQSISIIRRRRTPR
jgi:hypothetical protein